MIRDFDEFDGPPTIATDICVIGCGAAGIALAREFSGSAHRVTVLEGGGAGREDEIDDLYRSVVDGRQHAGVHTGRARVFGGTTTLWGGQALPLNVLDMQPREWVPYSGWPITEAEVSCHYPKVLELLKLQENDFTASISHIRSRPLPPFSPDLLQLVYSQWSPTPDLGATYRKEMIASQNIDVWLHANVTELLVDEDATAISAVEVRSLKGPRAIVSAKVFVVCCGGIETARLLLASRSKFPNGVGNTNDLVGRFFQDHLAIPCGIILPRNRKTFCNLFDQSFHRGVKFYPKLVTAPRMQKAARILSVIGNCYTQVDADVGIQQAKSVASDLRSRRWNRVTARRALGALRGGRELIPAAWRFFARRRIYSSPSGTMYLEAHAEQEPNPSSRIVLSQEEKDIFGMPRSVVQWRPSLASALSASVFARTVAAEFARVGLADVELTLPPEGDSGALEGLGTDLNHHIGTARMSETPAQGVTDPHCRVHGLRNLYIASSALFPTSGSSNPTFTLLALTYRIAAELRKVLD